MSRVLVAHGQELFLLGLRHLVGSLSGCEVVGWTRSGPEAIRMAGTVGPDVVILGLALHDLNGIDTASRLRSGPAPPQVLVLAERCDAKTIVTALRVGVAGYLPRTCTLEELGDAIRALAQGESYIAPTIAGCLVEVVKACSSAVGSSFGVLTAREREVLQRLTDGHAASETAAQLHISVKTVHTHRKNIMEKLCARSFADLVKYAVQEGLATAQPILGRRGEHVAASLSTEGAR